MNTNILIIIVAIVLIIVSFNMNNSDSSFKSVPAILGVILIIYGIVQLVRGRK